MAGSNHDPGVWGSAINFNHSLAGVANRLLIAERDFGNEQMTVYWVEPC